MTPWHCSIAVGIDGLYRTAHTMDLHKTHNLVCQDDRPYFYREKSNLFEWGEMKVEFEHLYPCGLIIRPNAQMTGQLSLRDLDMKKLRELTEHQSPVILRGFADTMKQDIFTAKGGELGVVLPGTSGILHDVRDSAKSQNAAGSMYYAGIEDMTGKDESYGDVEKQADQRVKSHQPPK